MRIRQKTGMALTALLIILNVVPVLNVKAEDTSEDMDRMQDSVSSSDFVVPSGSVSSSDAGVSSAESGGLLRFDANVEHYSQGYVVMGTLAELPSDVCLIQPLASIDGESWQICPRDWNLPSAVTEAAGSSGKLRTQPCLNETHEPFGSYLAGELDYFYVKLRLTGQNGAVRETEAAVIRRGEPQPLPEDLTPAAVLDRSVLIRQWRPSYREHGEYRFTVEENAAAEDVMALLPETVPLEVQLYRGFDFVAGGIVGCPVVWKPLTLPELIAGESVMIQDAAEELLIPGGTLLNTPIGIYRLEDPLRIDSSGQFPHSDEIRLILNVIPEQGAKDDARPNGDGSAYQPGKGGAGGNEGNAGTNDKGDSTEGGQRPNLPEETAPSEESLPQTQAPETAPEEENLPQTQAPETAPPKENGQGTAGEPENPAWQQEVGDSQNLPESPAKSQASEAAPEEESLPQTQAPETALPEEAAPEEESLPQTQAPETAPPEESLPQTQAPETVPEEENGQGTAGEPENSAWQQEAGDSLNLPESPEQAPEKICAFPITAAGVILVGITAAGICAAAFTGGKRRRIKHLQGDL